MGEELPLFPSSAICTVIATRHPPLGKVSAARGLRCPRSKAIRRGRAKLIEFPLKEMRGNGPMPARTGSTVGV